MRLNRNTKMFNISWCSDKEQDQNLFIKENSVIKPKSFVPGQQFHSCILQLFRISRDQVLFSPIQRSHSLNTEKECYVKELILLVPAEILLKVLYSSNWPPLIQISRVLSTTEIWVVARPTPTEWHVCPGNTQISLGICPVWSVFAWRFMGSKGPIASSCGQQKLWSDWADAQTDLSLRWAHMYFCWYCCAVAHLINIWQGFITAGHRIKF